MQTTTTTRVISAQDPATMPGATGDDTARDPVHRSVRALWRAVEDWVLSAPHIERRSVLDVVRRAERLRAAARSADALRARQIADALSALESCLPTDDSIAAVREAARAIRSDLARMARVAETPTLNTVAHADSRRADSGKDGFADRLMEARLLAPVALASVVVAVGAVVWALGSHGAGQAHAADQRTSAPDGAAAPPRAPRELANTDN